jgi:S-DNA-T family DNA segregation ATPase FtsK/SpoIIIE
MTIALWTVTPAVLVYREGRARSETPLWLLAPADREPESVIVTPGGIAAALEHLGIGPLNKPIKDGWRVEFAAPPVRVHNRGYETVFSLPMGVRRDARRQT